MTIEGKKSAAATDRKADELAERLSEIYRQAADELDEKAKAYFDRFAAQDERMREKLAAGEITEKQYRDWRQNKILYGRRYAQFREQFTARLANVNEDALAYINGEMPSVYAVNYNDLGTVSVDGANEMFGTGMSFALVDEETVRLLALDDPALLPKKTLDIPKDQQWNAKKMQSEILQGILLGEDIPTIAARLSKVTDANKASAVRNARTMVTSAQNRGRLESMRRTTEMGIVQKKHWISSDQPWRTRDWHMPDSFVSLTVDVDVPFENAAGKIMYPGDPGAAPENVYNCRCALSAEIVGFIDPVSGKMKKVKY